MYMPTNKLVYIKGTSSGLHMFYCIHLFRIQYTYMQTNKFNLVYIKGTTSVNQVAELSRGSIILRI